MTQASITPPAYPTSKSGTDLANDLSAQSGAINSTHQGDTSPTYAKEGLVWSGKNGRVCRKLSSGDCIIGHRPITSLADLRNFGEGQRDEDVVRISIGDTVYFYFWDADSTAADNGSTIILPSGWVTAGRWVRLNSCAISDIMSGTTANSTDIVLGKRMTNPNQVAFRVALSAEQSNVTGDGTAYKIPFNSASGTDLFNRGNCFNTSTFEFSAPVTGLYVFNAYIRFRGLTSSHTSASYSLVTSNGGQEVFGFFNPYALQGSYGGSELSLNGACVLPMDAGDIAYVQAIIYGGTKDADCRKSSFFSGYLLS